MSRRRPNIYEHLRIPASPEKAARFTYTFHLGAISIALFVVLAITGILEMFYYVPTPEQANQSVKLIAYVAPYGWLIRNMHFWAAQGMVVAVTLHLARVIFTGGYKRRRFNWTLGIALLVLTLLVDFTGYVLRWDDRGSWALQVGTNIIRAISPEPTPDPLVEMGENLFTMGVQGAPPCALCHSLDGSELVGPSLQDIGATGDKRMRGQSAEFYIRTSILTPGAYKPPGFENGSMFPDYGRILTQEQVDALVAFLLTR